MSKCFYTRMFHIRRYKDGSGCTSVWSIALPVSLASVMLNIVLVGWLLWKRNPNRVNRMYKHQWRILRVRQACCAHPVKLNTT